MERKAVRQLDEHRLHSWPAAFEVGDRYEIEATVLTPLRMVLLNKFMYAPLRKIWKLSVAAVFLDFLFQLLLGHSLIDGFPHFDRTTLLWVLGIAPLLMLIETQFRFRLTRRLFGRRIRILFHEETIQIKSGRRNYSYSRQHGVSFAAMPFNPADHPTYRHSRDFVLILSDVRAIQIAEVFDLQVAALLVANCNFINARSRYLRRAGQKWIENGGVKMGAIFEA